MKDEEQASLENNPKYAFAELAVKAAGIPEFWGGLEPVLLFRQFRSIDKEFGAGWVLTINTIDAELNFVHLLTGLNRHGEWVPIGRALAECRIELQRNVVAFVPIVEALLGRELTAITEIGKEGFESFSTNSISSNDYPGKIWPVRE